MPPPAVRNVGDLSPRLGHPRKSRKPGLNNHAEPNHAPSTAVLLDETANIHGPDAGSLRADGPPTALPQDRIAEVGDEQDDFIPVPIPDTSVPTSAPVILDYGAITSLPAPTTTQPHSVFSALPALPSQTTGFVTSFASTMALMATTSVESHSSVAQINEAADRGTRQHHQKTQPSHKISTVAIVLLAIGAGCLFLGLFLAIRLCWRPNRRTRPLPSLPIPNDTYGDSKRHPPDSPLFGGNERFSTRSAIANMPTWTPYPRPKLDDQLSHAGTSTTVVHKIDLGSNGTDVANTVPMPISCNTLPTCPSELVHRDSCIMAQTPANSPRQAPLAQLQGALARAATRVSMASLSLYPNSPLPPENMGIALSGPTPGTVFTADGYRVLNRSKSKASLDRSRSNSLSEEAREQDPVYYRYSHGLAYDGADVSSPSIATRIHAHPAHVIATPPAAPVSGGRARIKSAYFAPGVYPRVSTFPSFAGKPRTLSETSDAQQYPQPVSDSQNGSATEALNYALGLHSPADYPQQSSHTTLYPDDSASITGVGLTGKDGHTHKRGIPEDRHLSLPPLASELDTSSLGSLMLIDYTNEQISDAIAQSSHLAAKGSAPRVGLSHQPSIVTRRDDKPPRVPSPPPLPSLSQMALEHANAQAYAEYRSPTYSIYGLYEHERKSRAMSSGSRLG